MILRLLAFLTCLSVAVRADDRERMAALLNPVMEHGGVVTIPPGDYELDGAKPFAQRQDRFDGRPGHFHEHAGGSASKVVSMLGWLDVAFTFLFLPCSAEEPEACLPTPRRRYGHKR